MRDLAFTLGERAPRKRCFAQGVLQVLGVAEGLGIAQGNDGFDGPRIVNDLGAQAVLGLGFDGGGRQVFRLDDDGRAVGGGDQIVGPPAWVISDDLRVLGTHLDTGQHAPKQIAQGDIGVALNLAWLHTLNLSLLAFGTHAAHGAQVAARLRRAAGPVGFSARRSVIAADFRAASARSENRQTVRQAAVSGTVKRNTTVTFRSVSAPLRLSDPSPG